MAVLQSTRPPVSGTGRRRARSVRVVIRAARRLATPLLVPTTRAARSLGSSIRNDRRVRAAAEKLQDLDRRLDSLRADLRPTAWRLRGRLSISPAIRASIRRYFRQTRVVYLLPTVAGVLIFAGAVTLVATTSPTPEAMTAARMEAQKSPLLATLRGAGPADPSTPAPFAKPDQSVRLPDVKIPQVLKTVTYDVRSGDTLSEIAQEYGVSDETLVSFNNIEDARLMQPGTRLQIPNLNGVLYRTQPGDTIDGVAKSYAISPESIIEVNRLTSTTLLPNQPLFLPGAHMNVYAYRKAIGTLFVYPTYGVITSGYGMRRDPFTNVLSFHNGIDIANSIGTPIGAAMDGRVVDVGEDRSYGRYILIDHGGGYRTLYGHLSRRFVSVGQYVRTGQEIAEMGDTGYSTGPHLHFSIFKNYAPVNPMIFLGYR